MMVKKKTTQQTETEEEKRNMSLSLLMKSVEKQFGKGAIISGETDFPHVEMMPTSCLGLDLALGGGLGRGRIVEIWGSESSGKTTLTLHVIAECQKNGGTCAFIDAEHALDLDYAEKLGVDPSKLLLSQPDHGEQALQIVDTMVRSGAVDLIVIDSVAALVPRAELEGDVGDSHMGLQARLMSQALRKLSGITQKSNTTVVFINQIRMKIGVMFGCFHEDTPITFADGTQHKIRKVVEQRLSGPVLSLNPDTRNLEAKNIVNWYQNGSLNNEEHWITVSLSSVGGPGGNMSFTATPNHTVFVSQFGNPWFKEIPLSELQKGDHMISWYNRTIQNNKQLNEMLIGTMLGDGCMRRRDASTACLSLANQEQPEYLQWKLEMMDELCFVPAGNTERPRFDSRYSTELSLLREKFYPNNSGHRCIPRHLNLSPLSLAVWFMDDGTHKTTHSNGTISIKRLFRSDIRSPEEQRTRLLQAIQTAIGHKGVSISQSQKAICFNVSAFARLSKFIAPYVPECMQYKILPKDRDKYSWNGPETSITTKEIVFSKVKDIRMASTHKHRAKHKYDLEIQDNGNYLVGGAHRGVLVHNSPETTTGGNALKFYASQRLEIKRIKTNKVNDIAISNTSRIKVAKNKLAPPYKQVEVDIVFGKGIDKERDLLRLAEQHGIIDKSGAWYSYKDNNIGQGVQKTCQYLAENPQVAEEIKQQVLETIK